MIKYIKIIFFYFFKIIFEISTSKRSKIYKFFLIFSKNNFKFFKNTGCSAFPNRINGSNHANYWLVYFHTVMNRNLRSVY